MRHWALFGILTLSALLANAQTPSAIRDIDGLVAWFSADSVHLTSDGHVDIFYDKSGNGYNAVQNTVGKQPTWVATDETINNQPTLSFDGNDFLTSNFGRTFSQPNTFIALWKSNSKSGTTVCVSGLTVNQRNQLATNTSNVYTYSGNILSSTKTKTPFDYTFFNACFNGTNSSLIANGDSIAYGNVGSYPITGLSIGAENGGAYGTAGEISEIILVNSILDDSSNNVIMDYLRDKYVGQHLKLTNIPTINYGFAPIEYTAVCDWAQSFLWDDGTTSSTITISDNKKHVLNVTDKFGFVHKDSLVISYPRPKLPSDTIICLGDKLILDANLIGDYSYQWNNGLTNPTIEVNDAGVYSVTITDKNGYHFTFSANVIIDRFSESDIFDDEISICEGDTIWATVNGNNNYKWNTGESFDRLVLYNGGDYSVSITNSNGCLLRDTTTVLIKGKKPLVQILADTVHVNEKISFVSIVDSDCPILNYKWLFGDGETSILENPTYLYKKAGIYTATLNVQNEVGCSNANAKQIQVLYDKNDYVKLRLPYDNQSLFNDTITFEWDSIPMCAKYQIQIAEDEKFESIIHSELTSGTFTTVSGFKLNKSYFWRVRSVQGKYDYMFKFNYISFASLRNVAAWFSADSVHVSDDEHIDILYDKSGNARHVYQSQEEKQPILIRNEYSLNNKPTISFDGNNYFVSATDEIFNQPNRIITIWKSTSNNISVCFSGKEILKRNQLVSTSNNMYVYAGTVLSSKAIWAPFNHSIVNAYYNGEMSSISFNGNVVASGNVGNYPQKGITIGSENDGGYGMTGSISELIFINGTMPRSDSLSIMDYLRDKYSNKHFSIVDDIRVDYGFKPVEYTASCDWAQSFLWDDGTKGPSITISDNKLHYLTVTDNWGFRYSDYISIRYPFIDVPSTSSTICYGDTITWNPNLIGPYSYAWSDGSTGASLNISSEGKYWVVITDTAGYSWHSDTITVTIDDFPVRASLGADTIRACEGNYIYLADGYESATTYLWSTGDTTNHFEIKNSGLYSVNVVNSRGCRASDTAYYHVEGIAPSVNFAHDSLCQSRNVRFTNLSHSNDQSPITTYHWLFGNGDTSTQQNPDYTYQSSGKYEVKLMVECQNGCANEARKQLTVWQLPKANFVPNVVCSNTESQLFSRSTSPDDTISLWQWTINGFGYSDQNPQLQFADAGKVDATLVVTTAHGCTDTVSKTITIHKGPEADFNVGPICLDAPISLTNATVNYLNLAVDYSWKIDDDDFSIMRNAEVVLHDTMPHKVIMTIRQHSNGCESSVNKTIQAKSRPSASFEANDVCANSLPVIITAQGKNIEKLDCVWAVDSLPKIFGQSVKLTNLNVGTHTATLVATDAYGCHDTASALFNVLPDVQAAFVTDVTNGTVPLLVAFNNTTNHISEFNWDFGDGYSATERNVQHIYADSGLFNVTLTSTTANGCVTKAQKQISTRVAHSNLAIAFAQANEVANYIEIEATIINKGTVDEHNVLINCTNNLGLDITEVLPDTIFAHKVLQHKLNVRLNSRDLQNLEFVCLGIQSNNSDEDESDNEFCISFTENRFVVLQPKPNPATDHVNLEFVTQDGGNAQLAVYNANGEQLMSQNVDVESGIVRIKIDVSTLPAGNYVCILRHNGHVSKQRFVVMRGN